MSTEAPTAHRPDACPDPEQLAAFIDGGLPPDERTLVEEHVADCPECRDILGGSAESLAEIEKILERSGAAPRPGPIPIPPPPGPKVVSLAAWLRSRSIAVAAGLSVAAAVILVMWLQRPSPYYVPEMATLVRVETSTRAIEGRLSGFRYASPPIVTRGTGDIRNLELTATAEKVRSQIADRTGPQADAARGVTFLLSGDPAAGVDALERATVAAGASPKMFSDLAAAYLQRGATGDASLAATAAQRAIDLDADFLEAHYNRALALERAGRSAAALEAWRQYAAREQDAGWAGEARSHISRLSTTGS